jgi:hypothetical protein
MKCWPPLTAKFLSIRCKCLRRLRLCLLLYDIVAIGVCLTASLDTLTILCVCSFTIGACFFTYCICCHCCWCLLLYLSGYVAIVGVCSSTCLNVLPLLLVSAPLPVCQCCRCSLCLRLYLSKRFAIVGICSSTYLDMLPLLLESDHFLSRYVAIVVKVWSLPV